jgi:hypothetical protein
MTTNIITKSKDEWLQSVQNRPDYDDLATITDISTDPMYFMTGVAGLLNGKVIISKTDRVDSMEDVNNLFTNENIALYGLRHSADLDGTIFVRYTDISVEREGTLLNTFLADFKDADGTESEGRFKHSTKEGIRAQVDIFDNDDNKDNISYLFFFCPTSTLTKIRIVRSVYFKGMVYAQ